MADSRDQKPEDELRVVEDDENVVRLESPPEKAPEKLEKRGKPPAQPKKAVDGSPDQGGENEPEPGDPDGLEDEDRVIPMGWFYLLGLGMLGLVVWMGFQIFAGNADQKMEGASQKDQEAGLSDFESRKEAAAHFAKMEQVVTAFLAAGTIEERLKYVRHPDRIRPLMEDFYRDHELKTYTFELVANYMSASLSRRPFIALSVRTKEDTSLPVLLEDSEEGLLVDWESFICYNPLTPEEFLEVRPAEPVKMRVYASYDNFYAYEFAEESEYICFRLEFRDSDTRLFGYVKRGTTVEQKFHDLFGSQGRNLRKPLILALHFPEGGRGRRSVVIDDVESPLWAYAVNPAEISR